MHYATGSCMPTKGTIAQTAAVTTIKTHSLSPGLHHLKMWKRGEKLHRMVSLMYHEYP